MRSTTRNLPPRAHIWAAWCWWLAEVGKADSADEVIEDFAGGDGWCFACGMSDGLVLDRSHIDARCDGGSDDIENLHLLCRTCHKASEHLSGAAYVDWLLRRTFVDRVYEEAHRLPGGRTAMRRFT